MWMRLMFAVIAYVDEQAHNRRRLQINWNLGGCFITMRMATNAPLSIAYCSKFNEDANFTICQFVFWHKSP